MAIKSYLVHHQKGKKDSVFQALKQIEGCDVVIAENKDLLVLVTTTNSKNEEEEMENRLNNISGLKHLAMVAGFNNQENN